MQQTKNGLIRFLIDLADVDPYTRFGKVIRFEYYGNDCYLVEFACGLCAVKTFMGKIYIVSSYEDARQYVPPMVIPVHYPGDIADDEHY